MSTPAVVGVVLVGHGGTASHLLEAARGILPGTVLAGVRAVDAGQGEDEALGPALCEAIDAVDSGHGVLVIVDLVGASPYACAKREAGRHRCLTLSGLNLAMLLKLASADRARIGLHELAAQMAEAGHRAITIEDPCPHVPTESGEP